MNKYDGLLNQIAYEYSIQQGACENLNSFKCRIIYSVVGRMGLASLWDITEEGEVSIVHMKSRMRSIYQRYRDLYPELNELLPVNPTQIIEEIFAIYQKTGYIYHHPNRVSPAIPSESNELNGIKLTRGFAVDDDQGMSGLGTFVNAPARNGSKSVVDMFQLNVGTLKERWQTRIKNAKWELFDQGVPVEYLRMSEPYTLGYWVNKPDKNVPISLLRTGIPGVKLYYLYELKDDQVFISQIPAWELEDGGYRTITNECLAFYDRLPAIKYKKTGETVHVELGYLLPPAELNFYKLYGWPLPEKQFQSDFQHIFSTNIFEIFKNVLEKQEYLFLKG